MLDISPYATFQISDPKKFHHNEETFSGEIVGPKFHPVTHGLPRGSRDKWMDRDSRQMHDSEDSETDIIPVQRSSRLGNLYQINPPSQPPPPLPYQSTLGYQHQHHHHQILPDNISSDLEDGNSSSSDDPSRTTMDRRIAKKDR